MALSLPAYTLKRTSVPKLRTSSSSQVRHATLLSRPHRPYTFTQLITLSDGSTYTARTTSPAPVYKSTKDTRNHPLWQPTLSSLRNVENDEAGKLRAFRNKFGRGWDLDGAEEELAEGEVQEESLMDLISGSTSQARTSATEKGTGATEEVEMIMVKRDGKLVKVPKVARTELRKK